MRLILPFIALFLAGTAILFGYNALAILSAHNQGHTGSLSSGIDISAGAAIACTFLSVTSLVGAAISLFLTERNLISLPRLRRTKLSPAIRATIGTILIVVSIALSSNIQGETVLDLVWAAICILSLYYGFKTLGFENLRRRGY